MKTKVVEVTNGFNYGKFMVARFDEEWFLESKLEIDPEIALPGPRPLLSQLGWHSDHTWVLDLQTGEGALFWPVGSAHHDLMKHAVWVCPMFEPFLIWLYEQNLDDIHALPDLVEFTEEQAPSALYGYRRGGPNTPERT